MDAFARAHVSKKPPLKNDKEVKKQLKQILQGYKTHNNDLIRQSGSINDDIVAAHKSVEDTSIVYGFSDSNSDVDSRKSGAEEDSNDSIPSKSANDALVDTSIDNVVNKGHFTTADDTDDSSEENESKCSKTKFKRSYEPEPESGSEEISETSYHADIITQVSHMDLDGTTSESDYDEIISKPSSSKVQLKEKQVSSKKKSLKDKKIKPVVSEIKETAKSSTTNKKSKKRKVEDEEKKVDELKKKSKSKKVKNKKNTKILECNENEACSSDNGIQDSESPVTQKDKSDSENSEPFLSIDASGSYDQALSEIMPNYEHPLSKLRHAEPMSAEVFTFEADGNKKAEDITSLTPEVSDASVVSLDSDVDAAPVTKSSSYTDASAQEAMEVVDNETMIDDVELGENNVEGNDTQSESDRELLTEETISRVKVYYGKDNAILVLKHPTELFINGKVKIKALLGSVEVFGHVLKDEVELYAPNNHFAQCLKTLEVRSPLYGLFSKLSAEGLSVKDAEEIVTTIVEFDSVISMSKLIDPKMDFIENNSFTDLFTKYNKNIAFNLRNVSMKLNCSFHLTRPWRYFGEDRSWQQVIQCGLEYNSKGIVCGGKGVGKSTFLRYYVNKMLAKGPALVIDLDPGQAEFTVAGNVSATVVDKPLLGPNFTHLKKPDIMLNIGLINVMDHIPRYAAAVTDLLTQCYCKPAYQSMPWIVNTMGMCNQMGEKLLLLIILYTKPTFLLQINSKVFKKRFEHHFDPYTIRGLFQSFSEDRLFTNIQIPSLKYTYILSNHLEGSDKHNTAMSPREERLLNFLAYFGELMNIHKGIPFLGIVPYEVSLSDLNVFTNVKVANDAILKVINGKIVALCQLGINDKGKVFTLQDNSVLCHGHGLVRGVDFEKSVLYIVSPLDAETLNVVDTLGYADWAPELSGLEHPLPRGTFVPYRNAGPHTPNKQLMTSPRRRFNPLQLIKMARNA